MDNTVLCRGTRKSRTGAKLRLRTSRFSADFVLVTAAAVLRSAIDTMAGSLPEEERKSMHRGRGPKLF